MGRPIAGGPFSFGRGAPGGVRTMVVAGTYRSTGRKRRAARVEGQ